jgi:tRNA(Ile)-lysidine synthase
LLCIGRVETAAVCKAARIRPLADPTNRSLRFARNRVRLRVLPELAKLNPRVGEAIARLADAAAELEDRAGETVAKALADAGRVGAIDLEAIGRPEQGAVLASAWHAATGRVLSARHRAALAALADSRDGTRALDLPGGRAVREYARLRIVLAGADVSTVDAPAVLRPGLELSWNGWRLHLGGEPAAGAHLALVPDDLSGTLGVRARRPGDRDPAGRKLQDLFTDAKVPLRLRARWPVVTSDDGVWWVPGIGPPPRENARGTALAVYPPPAGGNARLSGSVRQVASKDKATRSSGHKRGRPG